MKTNFTSSNNLLAFSNQFLKYFKKPADSFRIGLGVLFMVLSMMLVSGGAFGQQFWKIDGTTATWTGAVWSSSASGPFTTAYNSATPVRFTATSLATFATTTVNNITIDPGITVTVSQAGTLTCTAARTFDIGTGSTLTWTGQGWSTATNSFGVIKTGAGTWDIGAQTNALNATNFGFTLNAGTVIVAGNNSFGGTTSILSINGGTIQSSGTRAYPNNITLGGNHIHTGTGNATFSGTVGLGASTRTITNSATSGTRIYSGIISGNSGSGLTFDGAGAGTINITGTANTYTGNTSINGSEVVFSGDLSFGAVPGSVTPNSIIVDGGRLTLASAITLNSNRGIQVGSTAGTSINGGGATYNGIIADKTASTGILVKQGNNTLILGGQSTYSGSTSINNGIIQLITGNDRLPTTTNLLLGQASSTNVSTLDLNGRNQTIAGLATTSGTATTGTNTVTSSTAATLTISGSTDNIYGTSLAANNGIISGSVSIVKSGVGKQFFGGTTPYTYTGTTTINGGTLECGLASILPATNVTLGGGSLSTGASTGFSQTVGILNLTASTASTITLGNSNHTLTFANSSTLSPWGSSATLTITGWTGTAGTTGTAGKIFVGSSSTGLTATQLAKISFSGFSGTATILSTGEIVPTALSPTLTGTATTSAFTTTYGTPSTPQTFTISGSNLMANLIATAPTGFEVSSDGTTYGSTATFTQSSGNASGSLRIHLAATATVTGSYNAQNIVLSSAGATSVNITTASSGNIVTPRALTITGITANNKEYDRLNTATLMGTGAYSGLENGETFSVTGTSTASFANALVGVGKTITVSGYTAPSANYTITQPTGLTANITAKALTVTGATASNKIYDGTNTASITGSSLVGIITPDVVNITESGTFAQSTIGNGIIVTSISILSGTDAGNYSLTQPTGLTANITEKSLTITGVTANNKNYDGTTSATLSGTASLVGVITTDISNVILGGTPTATFAQSSAGTGIAVTVTGYTVSGSASGNYTLSQPTGLTADIAALGTPVINSVLNAYATYGVSAPTYTITATNSPTSFSATGLPDGLIINATTGEITGTPTRVVGSPFSVIISATNASGTGTATLIYTINQKALTVSLPLGIDKVYDRNNSATITGTLTGIVGTDIVTLIGTGTFVQVSVGTNISISSTSTLAGANASNYILTQPTGLTANITTKLLTVTGATAANKIYDVNTTAIITGSTLVGVINPDVVSVSGNGTFASADVANGISVTTSLTLGGADANNYSLTQPTGLSANITAVPLTISGISASNKMYDGNINATLTGTPTLNGVINSDDVTIAGTPSATFDNKNIGINKPVTVTGYILAGAKANNYSLSVPTGLTANITAKILTATGSVASNKTYNGNTTATITSSTLVGVINPDAVSITESGTFANQNVGNGIAVTSTSTLTGSDASNYSLTQPTGLTANITEKSLTITGVTASNKNYDGTTTATLSGVATAALTGIVSSDESNVTLGGTPIANFAQSAVGNAIVVMVVGFTITGTASGNYSLTQPTGLTANITEPIIYVNTFTGVSACPTNGNTPVVATNSTGAALSRSTITCNSTANVFNSATLNIASTPSATSYIEFSALAVSGYQLNVTSLSFFRQASNSAPNQLEVRYSMDNFATSTAWGSAPNTPTVGSVTTWDFTDFSTQNAGTVIFRIYPYGTQRADGGTATASATGTFRLDDITIYGTVSVAPANTAPSIVLNVATTTNYIDSGANTNISNTYAVSGVINDPTDPAKTLGIDFTIGDAETAVSALTVTVSSSNLAVVPTANLSLTGTGATRKLKITPTAVGYSTITVSVNDGSVTTSFIVNYAASGASSTPANSHYLTGKSDASTAIMIDADYMLVGDDEDQKLRLYNRNNSGLPVNSFDFTSSLGLRDISAGIPREVDIEAATKLGNSIFWMGSESNASNGNSRPNRNRIFKTDIAGTGVNTTLTYVSRYDFMKEDILAWDANNTHGKGANYYGLTASATTGIIPESTSLNGFNIEGLEMAPNNTTAYIAFRAPQVIPNNRTKALIIPVTNFTTILSNMGGVTGSATFGTPIELDLDGRGIREIRKNANNEYLIIAGASTDGIALKDFRLYTWTGNPNDAPIRLSTDLTGINADGSYESVVEVPTGLTTGSSVQLLLDSGGNVWYGDAIASKDLSQLNFQKSRAETVILGDASLKTGTISNTTLCENSTFNVPFTINETFNSGNIFTAQLSDNTGSFLSPTTIGALTGTAAGNISVTIPNGQILGTAYRIRVISSSPSIICMNNGNNLFVIAKVTPTFTAVSPICAGTTLSALPTTSNNGITGTWSPALDNMTTTVYTFTPNIGQCANTTTLTITVNPKPTNPTNVTVNTTICTGNGVALSATCMTGSMVQWYENDEVTPLPSTNIPSLTASQTFKVRCESTIQSGCVSAFASAAITVNAPTIPTIPQDTVTVAFGTSVTLQASGCNGTVNWYNNSGILVNMPISPKCSDYYFAQCVVSSGGVACTSPSSRKVYLRITHPFEVTSIISGGNWEDASTWSGSRIPQNGDLVIINTAHTVFILSNSAKAQCLELRNNAVLKYSNPSSKLSIGF